MCNDEFSDMKVGSQREEAVTHGSSFAKSFKVEILDVISQSMLMIRIAGCAQTEHD
jgi:hypothetical protein